MAAVSGVPTIWLSATSGRIGPFTWSSHQSGELSMPGKIRNKLVRAALAGAVVPAAVFGLAGSARADDYTTLQFGPNWTTVGGAWDSQSGDVGFLGYKFYDSLTSPVFTVQYPQQRT